MTRPGPNVTSDADTQPGSDSLFPTGFSGGGALVRQGSVGTGEIADGSIAAADLNLASVASAIAARSELTGTYASPQGAWSSATAYTVNQVVTYNGGTYRAKAASTNVTPGTDATKWESWGGGGTSLLSVPLGASGTSPIKPAAVPPVMGPNIWQAANFRAGGGRNTTLTAPSLTANGTSQSVITWISGMNNFQGSGEDSCWRLEFDYDVSTIPSGWGGISILAHDGTGVAVAGTGRQYLVNPTMNRKSGHIVFDFAPQAVTWDFELKLETVSNAPSGVISISNVSLRFIPALVPPLYVSRSYTNYTPSVPSLTFILPDKRGRRRSAFTDFSVDGALSIAINVTNASPLALPFAGAANMPDQNLSSSFGGSSGSGLDGPQNLSTGSTVLRYANNDQILNVWNGSAYELRGNAHGGETIRGSASYKIDYGSGLTPWTLSLGLERAFRWQMNLPTQMATTTGTTFANVDHLLTFFNDGTMRCDRTTTFLANTQVDTYFEWMATFDTWTGYLGRIGRGQTVLGEIDTNIKLAAPVVSSVTTSTSGGALAAGTYSYTVTAFTPQGETTAPTASTVTTTGTTSSNTVTWGAVSNTSGYRIYGRTAGYERHIATVAGSATSWVDDGSIVPSFTAPATVNSAWRPRDGSTQATAGWCDSSDATWAAYYEPVNGLCYGLLYDRASVLARTGVANARLRLTKGSGTQKIYTNLFWANQAGNYTIPSGTAWTSTHWGFTYCPFDPARFHDEIAGKSLDLAALATVYPNA